MRYQDYLGLSMSDKQGFEFLTVSQKTGSLTLFIPGFFGWSSTGSVFHLHPVTALSFKSGNSNFVQNYFGIGSGVRKIGIKSVMTSL